MRFVVCVFCVVLFAPVLAAAQGPSPGMMSIYFDLEATTFEAASAPYVQVPTYVILTEPDFDTIRGYEFEYEATGNYLTVAPVFAPEGATVTEVAAGYRVDWETPLPLGPATLLATFRIIPLDADAIFFILSGVESEPENSQDLPAIVLADGTVQPTCVLGWDGTRSSVCAVLNSSDVTLLAKDYYCFDSLAAEPRAWDAVKSMYR